MPDERKIFSLPERYSFDEDTSLKVFLHDNRDANVEILGQNLRRIDSLLVQYFIAAARSWAAKGLTFEVSGLRADLAQSLELLGVRKDILCWRIAQ